MAHPKADEVCSHAERLQVVADFPREAPHVLEVVRIAGDRRIAQVAAQPLDRFGKTLSTLSLERKDADATLHDKTAGIEGYRRTVRFAAGCFASLYGLAGFDDLAAKIRPKRRASRRPNGSGPNGRGPNGSGVESGSSDSKADVATTSGDKPTGEDSKGAAASVEPTGPIGIVS